MFALLACTFALLTSNAIAATGDIPTYRAGFIVIDNYNYLDVNDKWRGYDIEMLLKISQYGDMRFETVGFDNPDEALDALRAGEVDTLINFSHTDERAEEFLYSNYSVGMGTLEVFSRGDDDRFYFGNISQVDGHTVGVVAGSVVKDLLEKYCDDYDVTPEVRSFQSNEALLAALGAGSIDLAATSNSTPAGHKTVCTFITEQSYMLFRAGDEALRDEVDDALARLEATEPAYIDELYTKYELLSAGSNLDFTEEELDYIASADVITVAIPISAAPFCYVENGDQAAGIIPSYYEVLSERTGLTFTYLAYETSADALAAVQKGEADVLGFYYGDIITAAQQGLYVLDPYTTFNCVAVTHTDETGTFGTVAVTTHTAEVLRVQLDAQGYDYEVKSYANISECYDALEAGEVDAVVCSTSSGTWLANQHSAKRLSIRSLSGIELGLTGCTAEGGELHSILNKAIDASETDIQRLSVEYTVADTTNIQTVIENTPANVILAVVAVLVAILAALVAALVTLHRRNRERQQMLRRQADIDRREAQLAAEHEFNEQRSQFFSNISHDMRTPLNAIIGFSDLASERSDDEQVNDYLSKIHTSGDILLNLINDTLTVSKVDSGKLKLAPAAVSLFGLLDEVSVPVRAAAQKRDITYDEVRPDEDVTLLCDRLNTQKVFLNLLTNAIKYTPVGGTVSLHVACEPQGEKDVTVRATVSDTGIGMDEDFLPHVFEPFVQEAHTGDTSTGTGLGLAIVKQLVDLMGGQISVTSAKGEGSTFHVKLPFARVEGEEQEAGEKNVGELDLSRLAGRNVLVCEDNALNVEIASALLRQYGLVPVVALDGQEGVEAFSASKEGEFACVLMDLRMPVMDGYEATRRIRALDRADAASVPIIALSADAFEDDVQRAREAGMNAHLAKPINVAKLEALLATL